MGPRFVPWRRCLEHLGHPGTSTCDRSADLARCSAGRRPPRTTLVLRRGWRKPTRRCSRPRLARTGRVRSGRRTAWRGQHRSIEPSLTVSSSNFVGAARGRLGVVVPQDLPLGRLANGNSRNDSVSAGTGSAWGSRSRHEVVVANSSIYGGRCSSASTDRNHCATCIAGLIACTESILRAL